MNMTLTFLYIKKFSLNINFLILKKYKKSNFFSISIFFLDISIKNRLIVYYFINYILKVIYSGFGSLLT